MDQDKLDRLAEARAKANEVRAQMAKMSPDEKAEYKAKRDLEKKEKAKAAYAKKKADLAAAKEILEKDAGPAPEPKPVGKPMKIEAIDKKKPSPGKPGPPPVDLEVEKIEKIEKVEKVAPPPTPAPQPVAPAPAPPKKKKRKVVIEQGDSSDTASDTEEIVYIKRKNVKCKAKPPQPTICGTDIFDVANVLAAKLSLSGSASSTLASGIDSRGAAVTLSVNTSGTIGQSTDTVCYFCTETDSLLQVGAQRQIALLR